MPQEQEREQEQVERADVEALLEVRRELGPSYDAALVDSFADRMERAIAERVDAQLTERRRQREMVDSRDSKQLALGIVSLGCGIPITAISASTADLPGLLVAWGGIAVVNLAYALSGRRRVR
jgi:predicted TPR repeat methyltransferase